MSKEVTSEDVATGSGSKEVTSEAVASGSGSKEVTSEDVATGSGSKEVTSEAVATGSGSKEVISVSVAVRTQSCGTGEISLSNTRQKKLLQWKQTENNTYQVMNRNRTRKHERIIKRELNVNMNR
jgi:hypothetical protein